MAMETREATPAEILKKHAWDIKRGRSVRFRGFVREVYAPRAKNGVAHREYFRSRMIERDGVPFLRVEGMELVEAAATVGILPDGREFLFDLRIKSPHLKAFGA